MVGGNRMLALVLGLALLAAACGGGEDGEAESAQATRSQEAGSEQAAAEPSAEAGSEEAAAEPSADPAQDLGAVQFVVPVPTAFYMPPVLADELGLFEDCGLDVTIQNVQPGPASGALASGEIQFGVLPGPVVHELNLEGSDLVFIGTYIHRPILSLVVPEDVASVEDLRGQPVAYGVPTSLGTIFMRRLLQDAGLDPDSDVQGRVVPGQGETLAAITSGQVQAAMLSVPQDLIAQREGLKVLENLAESDFEWPFAGIVTRRSYAEENPEQAVCVLQGIQQALERWSEEEEAAQAIIRERTQIDDAELVQESYDAVAEVIDTTMQPTTSENQAVLDALAQAGNAAAGDADPSQFFDATYLEQTAP